jgi:hypothetical protein
VKNANQAGPFWFEFESELDGPVYFTYITRAFIEHEIPPALEEPSIDEVIIYLRV